MRRGAFRSVIAFVLFFAVLVMHSRTGLADGAVRGASPLAAEILTALGGQLRLNKLADKFTDSIAALAITTAVDKELIQVGNLQEIIWQLQETGMLDQAAKLEQLLADTLTTEKIVSVERTSLGTSGARLVSFANGLRGVYKVSHAAHEEAMYRLDKLLGTHVFPITVMRTIGDEIGSMQLFIENAPSATDIKIMRRKSGDGRSVSNSAAINTLRLLGHDSDYDNAQNTLFPIKGRAIAIDGGHAFLPSKGWQGLWKHFREHLGQSDEEQFSDAQVYREYRIDLDFISRLEKITPEQIEVVIAPIIALDGDEELQKIFDKLITLANVGDVGEGGGRYLQASLGNSEFAELEHLRRIHLHFPDGDAYQKLTRITNQVDYRTAVALGGLHNRIAQYAALARGVDAHPTDMPASTKITKILRHKPEKIPRYRHEELLSSLITTNTWDKEKLREVLRYQPSMRDAVRKLASEVAYAQGSAAKPLLWRIIAADGNEHRLFASVGNSSLSIFDDLGLSSIDAELTRISTFIHSGRKMKDDYFAAMAALFRSELAYLFNLLPIKGQLLVWAKAGDKKIISAPYTGVSTRPKLNIIDQLEHEFRLHLAYVDGDLDKMKKMARLDFNLDIHVRIEALLAEISQHCGQGESCFIYADLAEVLGFSDGYSNFLHRLKEEGFVVARLE